MRMICDDAGSHRLTDQIRRYDCILYLCSYSSHFDSVAVRADSLRVGWTRWIFLFVASLELRSLLLLV